MHMFFLCQPGFSTTRSSDTAKPPAQKLPAFHVDQGLDRVDPLEYVFRRSWRWGNHHLISLAHHLECYWKRRREGSEGFG